jgi:hypothetical protein
MEIGEGGEFVSRFGGWYSGMALTGVVPRRKNKR